MKKSFYFTLFISSFLNAQWVPNLIETDLDGESHNLYSYLEDGKSVLLDFFMVNCAPCEEGSEYMDNLWHDYGPEGTGQLEILSIEVYDNTDEFVSETIESWNVLNPVINLNSIPFDFLPFVTEYPMYIMICPDKSMTIFNWIDNPDTLMEWELLLNNCNYQNNYTDIKLFEPEITFCQGNLSTNINIGNVGSNYVNEIIISLYVDSIFHSNIIWNEILPPGTTTNDSPYPIHFESEEITSDYIYFETFTPSDINLINNNYLGDISNQTNTNSQQITIEIQNDNYPLDINWTLTNNVDDNFISGNGTEYSPFELIEIDLSLDNNTCYTFTINDNHEDGMCCSFGSGYYLIKDNLDTLFYEDGAFSENIHSFYIESNEFIGLTDNIEIENNIQSIIYFNFQGQKINTPKSGKQYIKKIIFQNGNYYSKKYFKNY